MYVYSTYVIPREVKIIRFLFFISFIVFIHHSFIAPSLPLYIWPYLAVVAYLVSFITADCWKHCS